MSAPAAGRSPPARGGNAPPHPSPPLGGIPPAMGKRPGGGGKDQVTPVAGGKGGSSSLSERGAKTQDCSKG